MASRIDGGREPWWRHRQNLPTLAMRVTSSDTCRAWPSWACMRRSLSDMENRRVVCGMDERRVDRACRGVSEATGPARQRRRYRVRLPRPVVVPGSAVVVMAEAQARGREG